MSYEGPSRDYISYLERKVMEFERRLENFHRVGTVPKDGVKYDKDKKRWYVKIQSAKDGTDSDGKTFVSDWLPWETHASGWMKVSQPPHEGQSIQLISPFGNSEIGSCSPYHNNTDTPSPSDKEGEFHMRVEKPSQDGKPGSDKNKILNIGYTQDGSTVQIGDTTHNLSKDSQSVETKKNSVKTDENNVDTKNDTIKVSDTHSLQTKNRQIQAQKTVINSGGYALNGKVVINS